MFQSSQQRQGGDSAAEINIAPMLDMVFILLIFFLVTASFVRDSGIAVNRPVAAEAQPLASDSLRVSIGASGTMYLEGEALALSELSSAVRQALRQREITAAVVIPDRSLPSGELVAVIDAIKAAGLDQVAIATQDAP
jgi:biopolymer transport protein ExbD